MLKYKNSLQCLVCQTYFQHLNVRIDVSGCVVAAINLLSKVHEFLELHHNQ